MGKRTHMLVVVVVALFATAIGSIAAVASGVETAHACSIVGPSATARPAENLHPGQVIEISADASVTNACPEPDPEPWPCPRHDAQAGAAPPVPGAAVAPGFLPPCPQPCIDHSHMIDAGAAYDYRWDCPHPCAYPEANPGAATAAAPPDAGAPEAVARWCPPDPCPVYGVPESGASEAIAPAAGASEPAAPAAVWCPPPCLDAPADGTTTLCPVPDPRVFAGAAGSAGSAEAATATAAGTAMATSTRDHATAAVAAVAAMAQRLSRLADHIVALLFG